MDHSFSSRNASMLLPKLLGELVHHGELVDSRNGPMRELRNVDIRLGRPWEREILVPGRKPNVAAQIAETMWVLSGRDDVDWLARYLPRAPEFSDDGKVWRGAYGPRLRVWGEYFDQLRYVVDVLREDPLSRRAVMTIYDPTIDSRPGKDIPCNNWISFSCRGGRLDAIVAIRSNDVIWGWSGINAFEWSALLEIVAGLVGVETGALHFAITSLHLYEHHVEKADKILREVEHGVQLDSFSTRFTMPPPSQIAVGLPESAVKSWHPVDQFDYLVTEWFEIEAIIRESAKLGQYSLPRARIDAFPEPMLREWLEVINWWWTDIRLAADTRLAQATWPTYSVQPKNPWDLNKQPRGIAGPRPGESDGGRQPGSRPWPGALTIPPELKIKPVPQTVLISDFISEVTGLHNEKHAAYGDSWKRRGEMLGIMANIARKIDRLGVTGGGDTATDTAIDLLVYLAKYRWWLRDVSSVDEQFNFLVPSPIEDGAFPVPFADHTDAPNALLRVLESQLAWSVVPEVSALEAQLTDDFARLERLVEQKKPGRYSLVDSMLVSAYQLARALWSRDHQ